MILEDFFTLTEMRDGLSTRGRVEELVSVMQQQQYCVTGDAVRQWSAVATTLAVTENKECLEYFVQLSGLCYFDQWLQEAQKCIDVNDDIMEELIEALLISIKRLPTEAENYHYSEIMKTIGELLYHKSINIKHRARSLLDNWSHPSINDAHQSAHNASCENSLSEHINITVLEQCDQGNTEKGHDEKSARTEFNYTDASGCSGNSRIDSTNGAKVSAVCQTTIPNLFCSAETTAPLSTSFQENSSLEPLHPSRGMTLTNTGSTNVRRRSNTDDRGDVSISKDADLGEEREMDERADDTCQSSGNVIYDGTSHALTEMDSHAQQNHESKQNGSSILVSSQNLQKGELFDCRTPTYSHTNKLDMLSNVSGDLKDFPGNDTSIMKNMDVSETSYSRETVGSDTVNEDLGSEDETREGFSYPGDSPRAGDSNKAEKVDGCSTMELDEEFDPLAVARQVAIEVEREVFDYREPFCSSPEVNSSESTGACSLDSKEKQIATENNEQEREVPQIDGDFADPASLKQDASIFEKEAIRESCEPDLESEMASLVAHGAKKSSDNYACSFDLNEDACTEELQCSTNHVNLSAPKGVRPAPRGAPASLQFEGEFGFKGCAATSAFRPSSLILIDGEKTCSASKRKFHLFDLNIAVCEDEIAVKPSGLLSGDTSLEINSRGVKRVKLDLNKVGDEDMSPYPITYLADCQNGGNQCLSTTSSSSSRQPSRRDFDLNDNPSLVDFHNSSSLTDQSSGIPGSGSSKVEAGVFTFMGTPIERDYMDQAEQRLIGNGLCFNPGIVCGPPRMPYPHTMPPPYAYNGFMTAPPISISPAIYGPGSMPDMVDVRGATMVPQVLGPQSLVSIPPSRPPFIMGSSYASSSNFQLVRPPYPGADLNSAMGMDGGGGYFFLSEPSANHLQPSTSAMGLKRKEPDSGWESSYPFGYKEVTSWQ